MNNLWIFGDSFCAYNDNWVKELGLKANLEVIIKSRPASSIFYTYKSIIENENLFKEGDSVIVGITNCSRHLFKGNHFIIQEYINSTSTNFELINKEKDKEVMEAYGSFLKYLYDYDEERLKALSMVEVILNNFTKRLRVKNFIPFFTLNGERDFQQYTHLNFEFNKYPSMWGFSVDFLKSKLNIDIKDIKKIVEITSTPNHWIDNPEWNQHFWNTYEKLFKPIWNG